MKTSAISISKSNPSFSIIGTNVSVSTFPPRSVLYGSPSDSYIPLQHQPMSTRTCPENVRQTKILSRSPYYLSSDSETEDEVFDGTFNPNNPVVAKIFENVVKKLLEQEQN